LSFGLADGGKYLKVCPAFNACVLIYIKDYEGINTAGIL